MWSILVILACLGCIYGDHVEKELTKEILNNYEEVGIQGRPISNTSASVDVSIRFSLVQVLSIDTELQIFDFVGMVHLSWVDPLLTWNPSDYDNIQSLVFPWAKIWTPDIVLQNAIDAEKPFFQANAMVNYTGNVLWVMEYHFRTTCGDSPDYIKPTCKLKFGSWVFSEDELSLKLAKKKVKVDTSFYAPDRTWELQTTRAEKSTLKYPCCGDRSFGQVTFTLNFKRRPRPEDDEDKDKDSSASRISEQSQLIIAISLTLVTTYIMSRNGKL